MPGPTGSGTELIKRKRILLAESDGFTRLVMLFRFRAAGFEVDFTSNGTHAQDKLRERHPEAIITEIKLTGASGLDLIKAARRNPDFGSRPIYVYTDAEKMNRATRREVRLLATHVFDKATVTRDDLVKKLARLLLNREIKDFGPVDGMNEIELPPEIEQLVAEVRKEAKVLPKRRDAKARIESSQQLLSQVAALASCSEALGLRNLSRHSKALEALVAQLCKKNKENTDSAVATVAHSGEITRTLSRTAAGKSLELSLFKAVVIDEAPPSNKALCDALAEVGIHPAGFDNPKAASEHLSANPADLIIVNLVTPQAHGLAPDDLKKLRLHAHTPVISLPDSSMLNPSNGSTGSAPRLINANPLLLKEIVMKALNEVHGKHPPGPPAAAQHAADHANDRVQANGGDGVSPKAPEVQASATQAASRENGNGQPTVLFVEDDLFVLKVYKKWLTKAGFQVQVAEDGQVALDVLPKVKPDVVVLDLMLPKHHGLEVLKFIRSDAALKETPVVVLSNAYLENLAVKANEAGANLGILKTKCTPAKLIDYICDLLGRARPEPPPEPVLHEPKTIEAKDETLPTTETAIWARQATMRKEAPKEIARIRQDCLSYIKAGTGDERLERLMELYRRVRFFSARAGLSGFAKLAELCSALEGLLFQIVFKQAEATPSTLQTIAQAVDSVDRLSQKSDSSAVDAKHKGKILIVDDDSVCSFSMVSALKRANYDAVGVQDPVEALGVAQQTKFDMVLLDVNMPGLTGFEVCEQLRQMPEYKTVPVMFVTIDADFKNRARGIIAGGNDVVAKPICALELILKVTMHLINASAANEPSPTLEAASDAIAAQPAAPAADLAQPAAPESTALPANPSESSGGRFAVADAPVEQSQWLAPGIPEEPFKRIPAAPPQQPRFEQPLPAGVEAPGAATAEETFTPEAANLDAVMPESTPSDAAITPVQAHAEARFDASAVTAPQDLAPAEPAAEPVAEAAPQALAGAVAEPAQLADQYKKEREVLVNRLYSAENDLHRANGRIERRDKQIAELMKQLAQQGPATPQVDEARLELENKCSTLEQELAGLRELRETLSNQLTRELNAAAESTSRETELKQTLDQKSQELETARQETARQKEEFEKAQAELQKQLEAATISLRQSESAGQHAQSRTEDLQRELTTTRQARDDFSARLANEQQLAAAAGERFKQELGAATTELSRVKADLDKQTQEHDRALSDLRQQLHTATETAKAKDAAQAEVQARCGQLEQELATLRQGREELNTQLAAERRATAESRERIKQLELELGTSSTDLSRAKAELEKQTKAQENTIADLRRELVSATQRSEESQKQAQSRDAKLEQELAGLRQEREEINRRLAEQQKAAAESRDRINKLEGELDARSKELNRVHADLEANTKDQGRAVADLREQVKAAAAAAKQSEAGRKQSQTRAAELELELAGLHLAREKLDAELAKQRQTTTDSGARVKRLETELAASTNEVKRLQNQLEHQSKEFSLKEVDLRQQLGKAAAATKESEVVHSQTQARCDKLQQELTGLRAAQEKLTGELSQEQNVKVASGERIKRLEADLAASVSELKRAQALLDEQIKERSGVEADLRQQLAAAHATVKENEAAYKQAQKQTEAACKKAETRNDQLEKELAEVREVRDDLKSRCVKEEQAHQESTKRVQKLKARLGKTAAELNQARADLEQRANQIAQQDGALADLRRQLETANTAIIHKASVGQQAQARSAELEQELAGLRKTHEDMGARLTKQQQLVSESTSKLQQLVSESTTRLHELEDRLAANTNRFSRTEADLRQQVEAANASLKQSEAAVKQAQEHNGQLEKDLAGLRQINADLANKFAKEQHTSSEQIKDLESRLGSSTAESARSKAESEKQAAELRQQVEAAKTSLNQSETAVKQAQERNGQLEKDLAGLRQANADLANKFAQEQHASSEQIKVLEGRLGSSSAELARTKADSEKQAAELRHQFEVATASLKQSETAAKQAQDRIAELDQQLVSLRKAHDELNGKLTQEQQLGSEAVARGKDLENRLGVATVDLARTKTELEQQTADLRRQLEAANTKHAQSEAAGKLAQTRNEQLDAQLAALRQAHEDLAAKFAKEQQLSAESAAQLKQVENWLSSSRAELATSKAELEKQAAERTRAEEGWRRQLEAANTMFAQAEAAGRQAQARGAQLDRELAGLRQAHSELTGKFTKQQQQAAESAAHIKQIEGQLGSSVAELARAKSEFEKQAADHARVEAELRRQLETTSAALAQSRTAADQAQARNAQLEQELSASRQAHAELAQKLKTEQEAAAQGRSRVSELERQFHSSEAERRAQTAELDQRIRSSVAALARATSELAQVRGERQRAEQRATALSAQLEELHQRVSRILEAQRVHLLTIGNLEQKLNHSEQSLARTQAELEQERAARQLAGEQLQSATELVGHLRQHVASFDEAKQAFAASRQDLQTQLETSVNALRETESKLQQHQTDCQRLTEAHDEAQRQLQRLGQQRDALEKQLEFALESLHNSEAKCRQATDERQRLSASLETTQADLRDRSRRFEMELAKFQSALQLEQVERKSQESQVARLRGQSLEAARAARVYRAGLRQQVREPVHAVYESARNLLELELGERQKQLAEAVIQGALLLNARLQEPDIDSDAAANEAAAAPSLN